MKDQIKTIDRINSFLDRQFKKSEQKLDDETFERYKTNIKQKLLLDPEKERYFTIIHYIDFIRSYWHKKELITLDNYALNRLDTLKRSIEKRIA